MNKAQEKIILIVGFILIIFLLKNANMFYLAQGTYYNNPGVKFGISKDEWDYIPSYDITHTHHTRRCGSYERIHTYKRVTFLLYVTNPNGTTSLLASHNKLQRISDESIDTSTCKTKYEEHEIRDVFEYWDDSDLESINGICTANLTASPTYIKRDCLPGHIYIGPGKYTYKLMVYYYTRRYNHDYVRRGVINQLTKTITRQYNYTAPTPTPTPTPSPTASASPSPTVSPSPTASPTVSPSPSPSPSIPPENQSQDSGECSQEFQSTTICDNGQEITTATCKDGQIVSTGLTCENIGQQTNNTMLYILVSVLFLAIIGGVVYEEVFKK